VAEVVGISSIFGLIVELLAGFAMNQLFKIDLLILDDWGIQKVSAPQRNDLMEVIKDRHGRRSTLMTSQLPTDHWHEYIGEVTITRRHSGSATAWCSPGKSHGRIHTKSWCRFD